MLHNLKACYFDIDGTLLGQSHVVAPVVGRAIEALRKEGVAIGIATGRPWFAAKSIAEHIHATAPCMTYSGALITDPSLQRTLYAQPLETLDVQSIRELAEEQGWYIELYTETHYFTEKPHPFSEIHAEYLYQHPSFTSLEKLENRGDILKAVLMFQDGIPDHVLPLIAAHTGETNISIAYGASHPNISFLNITAQEASRENSLTLICKSLHCTPNEIMAFGDGEADIPFLSAVRWGVAMGNAKKTVQEAASFVTHSVEHNGIATFLVRFCNNMILDVT